MIGRPTVECAAVVLPCVSSKLAREPEAKPRPCAGLVAPEDVLDLIMKAIVLSASGADLVYDEDYGAPALHPGEGYQDRQGCDDEQRVLRLKSKR
jgi:hypothetical protein